MLIMMIHEYKLCRGVTAKLCCDLEIKYGSMIVNLPVPSRPFFVNKDEVFLMPIYNFRAGSKEINVHYHKIFGPHCKDADGKPFECDLDTVMTISIKRFGVSKADFYVRLDKELDSGLEIYRLKKGKEIPCSLERNHKD